MAKFGARTGKEEPLECPGLPQYTVYTYPPNIQLLTSPLVLVLAAFFLVSPLRQVW